MLEETSIIKKLRGWITALEEKMKEFRIQATRPVETPKPSEPEAEVKPPDPPEVFVSGEDIINAKLLELTAKIDEIDRQNQLEFESIHGELFRVPEEVDDAVKEAVGNKEEEDNYFPSGDPMTDTEDYDLSASQATS